MSETLKRLMALRGLNNPTLAKKVGCAPVEIWRLVKGPKEGGRKMTAEWAARLAPALGTTPVALLFDGEPDEGWEEAEVTPAPAPRGVAPIIGEVAAGRWLEHPDFETDEPETIPSIPGRYEGREQFAFKVSGTSMDLRRIFPGDFVICVEYFEARKGFVDGDIVVVERTNGHLIERTVKELILTNGGYELWPRSSDPKWKAPIIVPKKNDHLAEDGTIIEIKGLVIGRFAMM